ncbi:hypothetical protein RchiOBHm_Chr2g0170881 [Rosa chinensis]|uniref:Transmembrane protein n=1 Tax=Rosa chinensis TaxID=74649 RepID=A0A2P6S576_ROSCH|nr:hypothetical protein RchiOBHm_Chr2g0170881 [Rosa chinensis]
MAGVLKLQRFIVPVLVLSFILLSLAIEARPMHEHGSKIHRHQFHHHKEVHNHKYNGHRKAVPSPGGALGQGFIDFLNLWGVKNSGPSPGAGH